MATGSCSCDRHMLPCVRRRCRVAVGRGACHGGGPPRTARREWPAAVTRPWPPGPARRNSQIPPRPLSLPRGRSSHRRRVKLCDSYLSNLNFVLISVIMGEKTYHQVMKMFVRLFLCSGVSCTFGEVPY